MLDMCFAQGEEDFLVLLLGQKRLLSLVSVAKQLFCVAAVELMTAYFCSRGGKTSSRCADPGF